MCVVPELLLDCGERVVHCQAEKQKHQWISPLSTLVLAHLVSGPVFVSHWWAGHTLGIRTRKRGTSINLPHVELQDMMVGPIPSTGIRSVIVRVAESTQSEPAFGEKANLYGAHTSSTRRPNWRACVFVMSWVFVMLLASDPNVFLLHCNHRPVATITASKRHPVLLPSAWTLRY